MTKLFSTEAKWLCFVLFVFQMSFAQTCNVVTNSTFTGNSTGWTVGGTGVGWYYEPTWAPNEIYIEKDGATNESLRQPLTGLINNSLTLSFKIKGQNANRLSTCPTTATLVIRLGGVTYMTINNVAGSATTPNTQITTANITTSNGATYTQSGFPLTVGGATSAITITQGTITLTIPWVPATATAADLEFLATTSNTASGSCTAWGGDDWFLDDIMLYTSNPVAYNMTGSSVCSGTTTTVGLSNSQLGVNYQLYRNGSTAVGSPVAGTGSAISFGSQSVTGVYTAVATAGTSTCTTPMNNSVSINPNPTLTTAAQPAAQPAVCSGSAGTINLTGLLPSTTSTINYTINGVAQTAITGVVSDASGAGSFTTPVLTVANNGQTLRITSITNTSATPNCSTSFATDVILAVRSTPTLTAASQSVTACAGSGATINLTGLLPSVTSTISYSINGVAQSAVTGVVSNASGVASFTTVALTTANNGQNLQITGVTTTSTSPNCTTSFTQNVTLSVIASPTITTAAATGVVTAICQSASAQTTNMTYTATTLSPTSYSIDWATLTDQSSTAFTFAAGGGTVTGIIVPAGTSSGTYTGTMTVTSASGCTGTKAITLTINPVLTASVSISNSPAGTVCAGTNVTFTATPTNPGTAPVYQWKLNGVNVGTNSTTYSNSTLLLNNDVVTCEMTSNASPCLTGSPATSNAITVASAGPTTTGVTICTGGSGSLSSSTTCANGSNQTSGPNNARSGANNTGVGTIAWTNPGNITASGTPYATLFVTNTNNITNYLTGTDYNFSIPTNATIIGITVAINRRADGNNITDSSVRIIKGGVVSGTSQSSGATWSTAAALSTVTFGGTSNLWGTTWTPADINNANFGVALSAISGTNSDRNLTVDYMQITVTYTVPGSIDWYTASSGGTLLGSGASFNPVGVAGSGLANTNTVGTTTFYAECSSNPGCRTPVTFVINATPTIAAISSPSALCPGGSLNPAAPTVTANGSTVTATGWQLETTVGGGAYANLTVPYTVAFADSGKRIRYYATSGCGTTNSNAVVITVNPTPSAPTVGTITHLTCAINTGSVVLQGLPSGNWTINQAGDATASYNNTVPNTTSTTISGLAVGNYTFSVTDANGCPSAVSNVSILDNYNTWNGSSWSRGVPPNASMNATIASVTPSSPFTVDLVACALTINSGVVATVPSGVTLTITNEVTVNGSLTFENNASLVQINNLNNNSGSITYKRSSQAMKRYDFTYWSSPVENQTLSNLSPNTRWDKYLSYTGAVWKEELSSGVMQPGIGYIIRVPEPNVLYPNGEFWNTASYVQNLSFTGKPNNGNITSSQYMDKDKYYLIGNPYPSAINADDFLYGNANNSNILGGTVYFWTHNTAIKLVNSKYAYVSDDYASYNLTGGVASALSDPNHDVSGVDNGVKPTGYIAAGQSFFTSAESGSGYVEFTNEMRYGGTHNSQFFKPAKTSKSGVMEKHRLWLNMTNSGGAFKQTLIGYIEGATNKYDKKFDGLSFDGNSYVDFYSINDASNMTIQGRSLPFTDTDVVPLGYRSSIAGSFTIAIDQADGNLASQRIYLEDKQTGTISELTASNYTFTTKAGTFNNRFVLRYTNKTLGTGDFETEADAVWVVIQNKNITVNSTVENIEKVFIYDITGKQLYQKEDVNNLQLLIENLPFAHQVLLVKVVLDNGYQTTKKVIFK